MYDRHLVNVEGGAVAQRAVARAPRLGPEYLCVCVRSARRSLVPQDGVCLQLRLMLHMHETRHIHDGTTGE